MTKQQWLRVVLPTAVLLTPVIFLVVVFATLTPAPPREAPKPADPCETATVDTPIAQPSYLSDRAAPYGGGSPHLFSASSRDTADPGPGVPIPDQVSLEGALSFELHERTGVFFTAGEGKAPQLVVCEYRTVDIGASGQCYYVEGGSPLGPNLGLRQGYFPRRGASYDYLVFEAKSSKLVARFEMRGTDCPFDLQSDYRSGPEPVSVAVDERNLDELSTRLLPILTRPM